MIRVHEGREFVLWDAFDAGRGHQLQRFDDIPHKMRAKEYEV